MEIYLYMLFFSIFFYVISKMVYNKTVERILLFIMFFILFIVSAIRKHVGTDYGVYLYFYKMIDAREYNPEGMEIGYFYLNKFTKNLFGGEYTIFIVTSLIIIGLVYFTVKKFSLDPLLSAIIFMCIGLYMGSFNIIRQSIAIAFVLYSYKYSETKIIWIIPILIASLFHTTALMVIPFYLISKIDLQKKHYMILILAGVFLFLTYSKTVVYLTNFIDGFEHYQDSNFVNDGANPIRTIISISILVFCFITYEDIDKDKKMKFAFTMLIFGNIFALFMMKGKIFARVVGYFDVFQILLIPYALKYIHKYKIGEYSIFITSAIVCCSAFYFYYSVITNQGNVIPYNTYLN